ncbi:transposase [Paenibacillus endophyticus]|uniref:transposase n=1 Tax=Paenibacillus endophyticus TaxID=1294268 RepID=UPI00160AA0E8
MVCPAGEHSIRKVIQGSTKSEARRSLVYYFDVEKCKACPLRERCCKPESKCKTYFNLIITGQFKEQIEFELSFIILLES